MKTIKILFFVIISLIQVMLIWAGWNYYLESIRNSNFDYPKFFFTNKFWDNFGIVIGLFFILLPFYLNHGENKK